jgi:hypothetical protein
LGDRFVALNAPRNDIDMYHALQFYPRNYSRGIVAKLIFGGKDKTGNGIPEGLPLNCRFFPGRISPGLAPSCDGEPLSSSSLMCKIIFCSR